MCIAAGWSCIGNRVCKSACHRKYQKESADIDAIKSLLRKLSDFVDSYELISEMDLNPIFVYNNGLKIVDARIIL